MQKYSKKIVTVFSVYFLFLLLQHSYVSLYFDDFGYASLSYGYNGYSGNMSYHLLDIVKFMIWHYFNWGGRVLYFFFEIISIHIGLWFIQIVQSVILLGIAAFSYLLIRTDDKKSNFIKACIIIILYASLGVESFKEGIFWYSASVAYIWPLLPFLVAIYEQKKYENAGKKKNLFLSSFFYFMAAFSYEQIAVCTVSFVILDKVLGKISLRRRGYNAKSYWITILVLVGCSLQILAPGNFVRSSSDMYDSFERLSFWEKVLFNIPQILDNNLGVDNMLPVLFFILTGIVIIIKKKANAKMFAFNISLFLITSLCLVFSWFYKIPDEINSMNKILWIVVFLINITVHLWDKQQQFLIAIVYGGLISQGIMIISPAIPTRSHLPFEFLFHIVIASILGDAFLKLKSKILYIVILGFTVLAGINIAVITNGYRNNDEIHKINHYKMTEKSFLIKSGENINTIVLYRLKDDKYAAQMPYQQSFMEYWIKNYYEIPQSVNLIWNRLDEVGTVHERVISDKPVIKGVYPEKISLAEFNEDGSLNLGVTPEVISENLRLLINGEQYETVIDNGFISTSIPRYLLSSDIEVNIIDIETGLLSETWVLWK